MANRDVQFSLQDGVAEVLQTLTGSDLTYDPVTDRFQSITRALNRAMRLVALEHEWSYYSSVEDMGTTTEGMVSVELNSKQRPRVLFDDSVRLTDDEGRARVYAYFLPRDALGKYWARRDLRVAFTRNTLTFSRQLLAQEAGLHIMVPVMREPVMFRLPADNAEVPDAILNQLLDFEYPDLVVAKAAQLMAEGDPMIQPRVPNLEARYKDIMYQLVERDDRSTDSPYMNEFFVPIQNSIHGSSAQGFYHGHPHSDERFL